MANRQKEIEKEIERLRANLQPPNIENLAEYEVEELEGHQAIQEQIASLQAEWDELERKRKRKR